MSGAVTVAQARQIVTARIAAYDQAIAILGESPVGTMLRNCRHVWESMGTLMGEAERLVLADNCGCGNCSTRIVEEIQAKCVDMAKDESSASKALVLTEILGMFRTDWEGVRHDIHVEAERDAGRGERP